MRLAPVLALVLLALGHVAGSEGGAGAEPGDGTRASAGCAATATAAAAAALRTRAQHAPAAGAPRRCYTPWGDSFRRALGAGWPRSAALHASGDAWPRLVAHRNHARGADGCRTSPCSRACSVKLTHTPTDAQPSTAWDCPGGVKGSDSIAGTSPFYGIKEDKPQVRGQ